jgi:proton glutamate symport protein
MPAVLNPLRMPLHWQILLAMILGAAIGIGLNRLASERQVNVPADKLPPSLAAARLHDTVDRIEIELTPKAAEPRRWVVDPTDRGPDAVSSVGQLAARDPQAYALFRTHGRSTARWIGDAAQWLGNLFLRLLQMVAVPLIVTSLVTGVMGLGEVARLGRMFARTLTYYLATSAIAITTGIVMVRLIRPGLRGGINVAADVPPPAAGSLGEVLMGQIETLIPPNPVAALAEPNFLSIISFSLAFAIFALLAGGQVRATLQPLFEAGFKVMMAMTGAIIRLAPLGVFMLMIYVTATQGAGVFRSLAWYMLTVSLALLIHAAITLPAILHFVARVSPIRYVKALSPALLTAFSSASSNGTLPLTIACVEERAGINNRVSSFVLPLGATINMDGTALYEAVAVLFIAQLYHGGDLSLAQQVVVGITALLASIGAAGIPHAGLVMMVIVLQAVGLPIEMQGIILAVDRVLDMCRTAVNVWSDACGCAVVNRFEPGEEVSPAAELELSGVSEGGSG